MIYLRNFESHSQYETFTGTSEFIKPNVSLCSNENKMHYSPYIPIDYSKVYLTFRALTDGNVNFIRFNNSTLSGSYSLDNGATWSGMTLSRISSSGAYVISTPLISAGQTVMLKSEITPRSWSNDYPGLGQFFGANKDGTFDVEGNPLSMIYGDNFINQTDLTGKDVAFYRLFENCTNIVNAKNLSLPATTLATHCYQSMFSYCTNLTTAPKLPATTLVNSCYTQMFYNCTNLNSITCLATDISASGTANWVYGVAASGTFKKAASMTSWTTGVNGIPNGWTVQDA